MFDPKWGVIIVALGVFALAASYDAQLGLVAGGTILGIAAVYAWIRVRFAMDPGRIPSDRSILSKRLGLLSRNRREALEREQRKKSSDQ